MTLIVVWLLAIPGLLFVGACCWSGSPTSCCCRRRRGTGATPNVLAVAGAANGSFVLVALGLLISIPIVIWGSTVLLRFVERYPGFVYIGAGVLAFTAVKMVTSEPLLKDAFAAYKLTVPLLYAVTVFGVLWMGFVRNHRRLESRISARLASFAPQGVAGSPGPNVSEGGHIMQKVLIPVDASPNSLLAVRRVISECVKNRGMEVHLLNVQAPFSRHIAQFASRKNRDSFHHDEAEMALRPARRLLNDAGVPHTAHIEIGRKAEVIAEAAGRLSCDHIVMSTARKNSLTRMLEASVTNRVLELTTVPVEVIVGDSVSRLERYGISAGIGGAVGLLWLAAAV